MSTKYCKISLRVDVADDANYSSIIWGAGTPSLPAFEIQANKVERVKCTAPTTTGWVLGLGTQLWADTNVRAMIVKNLDPTNFVTVKVSTADSAGLKGHVVQPGGIAIFPELDFDANDTRAPTFTANTAACEIEVMVFSI